MSTRVALVDLPGLLADVVRDAFADEPDIDIEILPAGSAPARILAGQPDVVMAGTGDPANYPSSAALLHARPDLGLFAISPDAQQAWIHELRPHARQLGELSGPSLRAAVRSVSLRTGR